MSTSRILSIFVALALIVGVVVTVQAGIGKSIGSFSAQAALDQQERHPGFINLSAAESAKTAAIAEQGRLAYRRGEWNAASNMYAPLDAHERHAMDNTSLAAEQARLAYRRGEWNMSQFASPLELDVEQARLGWRVGK